MEISDIGSTDETALHCHTNYSDSVSGGDWIAPHGNRVSSSTTVGFTISRSSEIVRLLRNSDTPQQGIYQCVMQSDSEALHSLYIGLYNSGEGNHIITSPVENSIYVL